MEFFIHLLYWRVILTVYSQRLLSGLKARRFNGIFVNSGKVYAGIYAVRRRKINLIKKRRTPGFVYNGNQTNEQNIVKQNPDSVPIKDLLPNRRRFIGAESEKTLFSRSTAGRCSGTHEFPS